MREVSIEHLQRVRHANRGRLLLRTPGPVPLWDLQVFLCWDQYLLNLSCFWTFEFLTSLGTFVFAFSIIYFKSKRFISFSELTLFWFSKTEKLAVIQNKFKNTHIFNFIVTFDLYQSRGHWDLGYVMERLGYIMERLKSSLRKFYVRYGDLIKHYEVSLSKMLHDILGHNHIQWHPQLIRHNTYLRIYYRTGLKYRFWPYYRMLEVSIEHCNGCG